MNKDVTKTYTFVIFVFNIVSCQLNRQRVWTGFIQYLLLLITDNYNVFTNLHKLQIIITCLKCFRSAISSSTCCLVEPPTKGTFAKVSVFITSGFGSLLALYIALSRIDVSQLLCAYSLLQKCVLTSHCVATHTSETPL